MLSVVVGDGTKVIVGVEGNTVQVAIDARDTDASCNRAQAGKSAGTYRQDTERHGADKLEHRNAPRSHGCNRLPSRRRIRAGR